MKKFFIFLILIFSFQSLTKADDIRDFEIENLSLGSSLLDNFSKNEIINFVNYDDLPSDMSFRIAEIHNDQEMKMKQYDAIQVYYKPEDSNYVIQSLNGIIVCNDENNCNKIFNQVVKDFQKIYGEGIKKSVVHPDDKTGKSIHTYYEFFLNTGSISVTNRVWSEAVEWTSVVSIGLYSDEVSNWIKSDWGTN